MFREPDRSLVANADFVETLDELSIVRVIQAIRPQSRQCYLGSVRAFVQKIDPGWRGCHICHDATGAALGTYRAGVEHLPLRRQPKIGV
jgi:hypothetical protein